MPLLETDVLYPRCNFSNSFRTSSYGYEKVKTQYRTKKLENKFSYSKYKSDSKHTLWKDNIKQEDLSSG